MSEQSEKLVAKGERLFAKGSFYKSLKTFREATDLDPQDKFAWNNRGVALEEFNKVDEALVCYNKAIEIDREFGLAWTNKGYALVQQGKFKQGVRCYRKALRIDPGDDIARERLKQALMLVSEIGEEKGD